MIVYKNKNTSKYFILLKELENDELRLITPLSEIKNLKKDIFEGSYEQDEHTLFNKGWINERQIKKYQTYLQGIRKQLKENNFSLFGDLTSTERDNLLDELEKLVSRQLSEESKQRMLEIILRKKYPKVLEKAKILGRSTRGLHKLLDALGESQ